MAQNFYIVLGVDESAAPAEIQQAYRRLARAYHPDVSGAETAGLFREVQEAWDTLRDPESRRAYDARLRREREASRPAAPPRSPRPAARQSPASSGDALHLGLWLSPAECRTGGSLPVELPAYVRCPFCGGAGRGFRAFCRPCRGEGYQVGSERFLLQVPPGLTPGQVIHIPLEEAHLVHRVLVLHVQRGL